MSNLSSVSGHDSSFPSGSNTIFPQQYFSPPSAQTQPAPKKKRSLPGNPDPEAEVISLSPNSLLATNRFVCDVCNKGFKRDQNLQLHRRGHNLPWKLKQRVTGKEGIALVRKKVYVCPESSCVHHDPSRALGDLTGIKKHFCRKHGEKKWKCEKCSKKYAVQSDWKAHSKTCGTREYRCDCGTMFSRRDSFITHRAFCDALAEESVRAISSNPLLNYPQVQSQFINNTDHDNTTIKKEQQNFTNPNPDNTNIPVWLYQDFQNPNSPSTVGPSPPHLSATALLQKASQMGHHVYADPCNQTAGFGLNFSSREGRAAAGFVHSPFGGGNSNQAAVSSGVLSSGIIRGQESPAMAGGGAGTGAPSSLNIQDMVDSVLSSGHGFEGMTKDFLGLRPLSHSEILNMGMAGFSSHIDGLNENQNQTQKSWQGN
ncbi:hypothetical protein RHMOL_Rhmol12G0242300 [Rhododendron molle]|uniref:Uncharacterized protein n=1 Tax=Rhododendron molle TaxID=49168 RepID=A0ACC0LMQ6_RHOML|nr:hypothetical protein RHMOL_Rhmol12G0242300 [Rhododendron molle]